MVDFQQFLANSPVATRLFPVLADSAVKACLIIVAAALVAMALRKASAASRHLVWVMALVAVMLVPVLSTALPKYRILPSWLAAERLTVAQSRPDAAARKNPSTISGSGSDPFGHLDLDEPPDGKTDGAVLSQVATSPRGTSKWATLASAVCLVWALGVFVMVLRMALSRWVLHGVARTSEPMVDEPLLNTFSEARQRLDVRSPVHVALTGRRSIPMMWGILKTYLLLPRAAREWEPGRLRAVLLHELGHVKRRDTVVHALTQLVCAAYWFHPLAWYAAWRIHVERERACDDVVLRSGIRPSEYAGHLLEIMTRFRLGRAVPCGALAMARTSQLEGRLLAILNENISRKPLTSSLLAGAVFAAVTAATAMATLEAKPVSRAHNKSVAVVSGVQAEAIEALRSLGAQITTVGGIDPWKAHVATDDSDAVVEIDLEFLDVTNDDLRHVAALANPQLRVLRLWYNPRITDAGFREHLGGLTQLKELNLHDTGVTKEAVTYIKAMTNLENLVFKAMTDESLKQLSGLKKLKSLNMAGDVTDAGAADLKNFPNLRSLRAGGTLITDAAMVHLKKLKALEHLALGDRLTDGGLNDLKELSQLRDLSLGGPGITDTGLKAISELPNLRNLVLMGAKITDRGLQQHLPRLSRLRFFRLSDIDITDAGMAHLKALTNVTSLWLSNLPVTDAGLVHLKPLTTVRSLTLSGCDITDDGLVHLRGLTNLTSLNLKGTDVSDEGVEQLDQALPKCKITYDGGELGPISAASRPNSPTVPPAAPVTTNKPISYSTRPRTIQVALPPTNDADRAAEAALKALGAEIERNDEGEVVVVRMYRLVVTDADMLHLAKLNWDETDSKVAFDKGDKEKNTPSPMLDIRGVALTNDQLKHLETLTRLRSLILVACKEISDAGLVHLQQLTNLEQLRLAYNDITDAGLAHLKPLANLRWLSLSYTKITDAGLAHLKGFNNLEFPEFQGTKITDAGLAQLKPLASNIRALNLTYTKITDAGLAHLKEFSMLEAIELKGTKITNAGLVHLKDLAGLRILDVSYTSINHEGLVHLKGLNNLESVWLGNTDITDESLMQLKGLANLTFLDMHDTKVNEGLVHLKRLATLRRIWLSDTDITDESLMQLKDLASLRFLIIEGTEVSDEAVEQLHEALPKCRITYDGGVLGPAM